MNDFDKYHSSWFNAFNDRYYLLKRYLAASRETINCELDIETGTFGTDWQGLHSSRRKCRHSIWWSRKWRSLFRFECNSRLRVISSVSRSLIFSERLIFEGLPCQWVFNNEIFANHWCKGVKISLVFAYVGDGWGCSAFLCTWPL